MPRHLALVCISIYRHAISPLLPPSCRYVPSCSEYASIAIKRFGFLRGTWLSVKRVGRCHPFRPGGYDPVPEEMGKKLA
ncbi:MAG: membrane protein insertion efficiency factor YidD [Coriobacteriia bacterium]|nr:membrane protein insertion efficiency factor YidD [Coriobacteriia bacterium]MCL2749689.1 membrane protein insertion efficiency factor YidD [Coriobacteriia bacterium]